MVGGLEKVMQFHENQTVIQGLFDGIRPAPVWSVSTWAEQRRKLSTVSSSSAGRWNNNKTPYLMEIMNCFDVYSPVQKVVFMKGSQIGGTEAFFNALGYYIDTDPCSMIYVMPTQETVKRNSTIRFDPMVRASETLRQKVAPAKSRDGKNSILQKQFPGGVVFFCGANSAAPLRSIPVRIVVLDEVDEMPLDVDGQGSPEELAAARTRTFPNRKMALISTPTRHGSSAIEREYLKTSQEKYHVPCPHCGVYQVLTFDHLNYKVSGTDWWLNTTYLCDACGRDIQEKKKPWMLQNGTWEETAPELRSKFTRGFHLSSMYSPYGWFSWGEVAKKYVESEKNPTKRKVWVNTVAGETYKEEGEVPDWEKLFGRRIEYKLNKPKKDVVLITAGVDVQKDRLEIEIKGWCRNKVNYSLDYRIFTGDTAQISAQCWQDLDTIVTEKWEREDGAILPLTLMAIDSGFNTQTVYKFCRNYSPNQVIAVKGRQKQRNLVSRPVNVDVDDPITGKKMGELQLRHVGTDIGKTEVYGWLNQDIGTDGLPEGYSFFPKSYDEDYFKMLTAEKLQKVEKKGYTQYEWVKIRPRNEALDCFVYNSAAITMVGVDNWTEKDWDVQEKINLGMVNKPKKRRRKPKNSIWGN